MHYTKCYLTTDDVHVTKLKHTQISYPKLSLRLDPKLERLDVTLSLF